MSSLLHSYFSSHYILYKMKKDFNWKCKKYTLKEKILGQTLYREKVYRIFTFIKLLELDLNYICAILVIAYIWMSKFTFSHVER